MLVQKLRRKSMYTMSMESIDTVREEIKKIKEILKTIEEEGISLEEIEKQTPSE